MHDYSGDEDGRDEEREVRETRSLVAVSFTESEDPGKKEITHKSYVVDGESLDWASSAPVPASRIRCVSGATQVFRATDKIGSATFAQNVGLGGPTIVPNTHELTFQLSIVSGDSRLRVLVIYDTFDTVTVPSSSFQIPLSFVISDVIITREVRETAVGEGVFSIVPAELGELASLQLGDEMKFEDFCIDPSKTIRHAVRSKDDRQTSTDGGWSKYTKLSERTPIKFQSEKIRKPGSTSIYEVDDGTFFDDDDDDDDEEISMLVTQTHRDVQVELPRVILAGESVSARVTWLVPPLSKKVHAAEVFFSAAHAALRPVKRRGGLNEQYDQPILEELQVTSYFV